MSMNLKCKEVELLQTPTHITKMCLFRANGQKDSWPNVLYRYTLWFNSLYSVMQGTKEEIAAEDATRVAHLKMLDKAVKKHKRLHFYMI